MLSIAEMWEKLITQVPSGEALNAILFAPQLTHRLYAAIDSNNHRHLLVMVLPEEEGLSDSSSRGLRVTTRELVLRGEGGGRYIDLECRDNAGYPALDLILSELAEFLSMEEIEPSEAVNLLLSKWRSFWGRIPRILLSRQEQIGLFAEIWFLKYWLVPRTGPEGIHSWKGPWKYRHDFVLNDRSVEVKASFGLTGGVHHIHGLEQLERDDNGPLYILSIHLREGGASSLSLTDLISYCNEDLQNDYIALGQFETALLESGYSPVHADEYSKLKVNVEKENLYLVTDNFPRLTTAALVDPIPAGVRSVEYIIDLTGFDHLIKANDPGDWTFISS